MILTYILRVAIFWIASYSTYRLLNNGLAKNSCGLQRRRFFLASLICNIPLTLSGVSFSEPSILLSLAIAIVWMLTYPMAYHLTNRKKSPDYDNHMDGAFALYLFGILSTAVIMIPLLPYADNVAYIILSLLEWGLLIIPLFQIGYFLMYKICIDTDGMKILQETHVNEVIEYIQEIGVLKTLLIIVGLILMCGGCIYINITYPVTAIWIKPEHTYLYICISIAFLIFFCIYSFKPHHGLLTRTGIAVLFHNVKEYVENNKHYTKEQKERLKTLKARQLKKNFSKPSTILMVIGESANRDYMQCFNPENKPTTPWMSKMAEDTEHTTLFKNAYSCAVQTVPSLEKALTEASQYNKKPFYTSCSIVDIAKKLGYRVHWYSNQGHLGVYDTPISLIAETSDVAKWTKQEINKVQYDESLISFFEELDPSKNNFLVMHLKGSHFNFLNRYPKDFTRWGTPGVQENELNYINSIHYSDHVLSQAFKYCREKLNLQAMIYFSDHSCLPVKRRTPNMVDYGMTHIPLFTWLSDEYQKLHKDRSDALKNNKDKYFTNDLIYDLMCGIFDIESNHFDEENCLASSKYKYEIEDLVTWDGKKRLIDDRS